MIDNEYCGANLTDAKYAEIGCSVADLYEELGIKTFPIDPFDIAKRKGFVLKPYSQLSEQTCATLRQHEWSGASMRCDKSCYIYYDDSQVKPRQRFTVMHEIGHILLGHKQDSDYAEKCANHFAAYALAPPPIVWRCKCNTAKEAAKRFDLSMSCAENAVNRSYAWASARCDCTDYEKRILKQFENIV